jgi:tetratricopeptide (TPR) repeat protein
MICPRCGRELADRSERCSYCAAHVEQTIATGLLTPPPPPSEDDATKVLATGDAAPTTAVSPGDLETRSLDTHASTPRSGRPGGSGPLEVGQAFGSRYHIIRALGIGGMGAVYQAWDAELGVAVAMKVIRRDVMADPAAAADVERRFKRELLLARQVTHNNVVRIYDLGEIDGIKYITMSYVDGADLATRLRRDGTLPVSAVMPIARQIASALVAAHKAGVIHRDLKPANIMIDSSGDALIMDFGIARLVGGPKAESDTVSRLPPELRGRVNVDDVTKFGSVVGTVEYMAPEQARGQELDHRADLYSFGLILYDMLVGRRRRSEGTKSAVDELKGRMLAAPPPVKTIVPDIPDALDRLIARCLEPDPAKRYDTTEELAAALARLDDNGVPLPVRRVVGMPVVAAASLLAVTLQGGMTWYVARRQGPAVEHAPVSVLIADFENRANDPAFNESLEQALALAVEDASFITSYRRDEARKIGAQLRPGSPLNPEVAKLVSLREGINVLLEGSIEANAGGYLVSVRAVDPGNDKVLTTATATAAAKTDVLRALSTTAARIRTVLGDTTPESAKLAAVETVTTASLQALADYSRAQDFLYSSKDEQAIEYYKRAIAIDPNLGRAYSGWAISAENLGRNEEAKEAWKKALALVDRMTEREKYRTLGNYYVHGPHNYEKAIESFSTLIQKYPHDRGGHVNLALAYFYTRNFAKALDEGRRAVEDAPKDVLNRMNYALYAMYAADFDRAAAEAATVIKQDPAVYRAYMPLAMAALAKSDFDAARRAYETMAQSGPPGASLANLGLADLAVYRGQFHEAEALLTAGILEDQRRGSTGRIAAKQTALAEAYLGQGKTRAAIAAARRAMTLSGRTVAAVPPARVLVAAGQGEEARALAADLIEQLDVESRAYGRMLEGEIALRDGRKVTGSEAFAASQKLVDLWWTRLGLGIAYVQAEHDAEALGELERADKRRGEATAILLDDLPSVRYLAPLPYWMARAQDALGQRAAAVKNYEAYLTIRAGAESDPLLADAQRRVRAQ